MMAEAPSDRVVVSAEQLGLQTGEAFDGDLDFDLGNLMASDPSPQDVRGLDTDQEAHCLETATRVTQSLVAKLFQLPGKLVGLGRVVELPAPVYPLPRQKPLPKPRPPTRWEKFAQQKGIQKRKRSVKVWDEDQQEWRRRYGYQRAGDDNDIPIIEAKPDDKVGEDPFTAMKAAKAERVKSSEKRQLANLKHTLRKSGKSAVPPTLKLAAALPEHGRGVPSKRKDLKDEIKQASKQAGIATASMGKFDKRLQGEKPGERQLLSKRRKYEPVVGNTKEENNKVGKTVERILREKADDIVDMERAVNVYSKQKKQEGKSEEDKRGKGNKRSSKGGSGGKKGGKVSGKVGAKGSRVGKAKVGGKGNANKKVKGRAPGRHGRK